MTIKFAIGVEDSKEKSVGLMLKWEGIGRVGMIMRVARYQFWPMGFQLTGVAVVDGKNLEQHQFQISILPTPDHSSISCSAESQDGLN